MGWFDDDLQPRLVGTQTTYFYGTQKEVFAAPITTDGRVEAYAFYSVDPDENAAGFVYRMRGDFPSPAWFGLLKEQYAAGLPAADAIARLLGTTSADGRWTVGAELFRAPSKDALRAQLNPETAEAAAGSRRGRVSPEDVDAVLRGERESTREITQTIADLDHAVSLRPVSEPLVVKMPRTLASLPANVGEGTVITEPTFLRTVLASKETSFPDAEAVLTLRVEPGTPAVFVEPENERGPGTLLLGRGLTWQVAGVVRDVAPVAVFGRISPAAVGVDR